jgi:chromosome segregation ATPase
MSEKEENNDDVEIKKLFQDFKKQITNLKSKRTYLENNLKKMKSELEALQQEEFSALNNLQKLIKDGIVLNEKRAQMETELNDIKEKLLKLTKISI